MRMVFLVEEPSMKEVLKAILPRILPETMGFIVVPHNGKSDLMESIPHKLRGWRDPTDAFVILEDQDRNDCRELKSKLAEITAPYPRTVLIRIVCHELEAWYWGDLLAVSMAYGRNITHLAGKRKYRVPDAIENPKEELRRYFPAHQQILGAIKISAHMRIDGNSSRSFQIFVAGVQQLAKKMMMA